MSLSTNPLAKIVTRAVGEIAAAAESNAQPNIGNEQAKKDLDALVAKQSGEYGSGLNQATAKGVLDQATTGMGNIDQTVQSSMGGNSITSLADTTGNFGAARDLAAGAGAGQENISTLASKFTGGSLASGVKSIAGAISKGAGILNDILSLKRGENLPAGGEVFDQQGAAIKLNPGSKDDWRVRISCEWSIFNSKMFNDKLQTTGGVVFPYQPTISLSTRANYNAIDPVHNNYPFQAYKNSQIDDIQISGEFTAENESDAAYWIAATTFFRTVTKMFFGTGPNAGNPPPVCQLNGYGASIFDNVPIIVKSFNVEFPKDVNYIRCNAFDTSTWVPIMSTLTVTVTPLYNRESLRKFSLEEFSRGALKTNSGNGFL